MGCPVRFVAFGVQSIPILGGVRELAYHDLV